MLKYMKIAPDKSDRLTCGQIGSLCGQTGSPVVRQAHFVVRAESRGLKSRLSSLKMHGPPPHSKCLLYPGLRVAAPGPHAKDA